ncbi:MAG: group 1 glycosyl transferase [Actinomycetia bacterium]|nr:group 1 glycosyl transferase [Actinomycetes bacterium]
MTAALSPVVLATTAAEHGGVWRHVLDLARGLRERGEDVRVALAATAEGLSAEARDLGLTVIPLLHAERAAIWHLHLHDTYDRRALPLLARQRLLGARVVVTEHLPRSNASDSTLLPGQRTPGARAAKTALKRAQARLTHRIVALSDGSLRFLQERYALPPAKLVVIPNGVDVGADPGPAPVASRFRVVAVGTVAMQKGHDVLLEAAVRAREDWLVTVVGDGPARPALEARAAARAPGRFTFVGWREDVASEIRGADCVCLPSRWESCPYAVLEAMANGRAVVATAVDGLAELVEPGRTGLLVPPDDPQALRDALDHLATHRSARESLGHAGHARARRLFTPERALSATVAVYREVGGARWSR